MSSGANLSSCGRMRPSKASRNFGPPSPARSGALTIVSCSPRSWMCTGARKQRHLVGRAEHDARVVPENVLSAVAVMHVEIDHRDAAEAVLASARSARQSRPGRKSKSPSLGCVRHGGRSGRVPTNTFCALPLTTASTPASAPPTPRIAASQCARATSWCRRQYRRCPATATFRECPRRSFRYDKA